MENKSGKEIEKGMEVWNYVMGMWEMGWKDVVLYVEGFESRGFFFLKGRGVCVLVCFGFWGGWDLIYGFVWFVVMYVDGIFF